MEKLATLLEQHPWMLTSLFWTFIVLIAITASIIISSYIQGRDVTIGPVKISKFPEKRDNIYANGQVSNPPDGIQDINTEKLPNEFESNVGSGNTVYSTSNKIAQLYREVPNIQDISTVTRPETLQEQYLEMRSAGNRPRDFAILHICNSDIDLLIQKYTLEFTVGRSPDNYWPIAVNGEMSRTHFRISAHDSADSNWLTITDLNSTNGTSLNGDRLLPNVQYALNPEDIVEVGEIHIKVLYFESKAISKGRESTSA